MKHRSETVFALRAACLLAVSGLLGGCFLAEDDEANPLVPDSTLAYPIKFGDGRECEEKDDGELSCEPASFARLPDGGYSITVYKLAESDEDSDQASDQDSEPVPSVNEYKLRALSGPGVPARTYLVQTVSTSESDRYLGLLKPSSRGGWLKISPNCNKLSPQAFVDFMNQGWLRAKEGATLDNLTCFITRDGLDDARIYSILSATRSSDNKILFSAG